MTEPAPGAEAQARLASAEAWHREHAPLLGRFAAEVQTILRRELQADGIVVQSVSYRLKTLESFLEKSQRRRKNEPDVYKYSDPVQQISDVAGVRVVTYLQTGVTQVEQVLQRAFQTSGREQVAGADDPAVPGYRGVHYLVGLTPNRLELAENRGYQGFRAEVQVQTVLQHAWAEIQHDVLYKGGVDAPAPIRRRLVALAGLLELADAEFRSVAADLEEAVEVRADQEVVLEMPPTAGVLDAVRLRSLLHRHLGHGERVSAARLDQLLVVLRQLGVDSPEAVASVLERRSDWVEALRPALGRPGYEPGPVELLDALLRLELGTEYLERRAEYQTATAQQQADAQEGLAALIQQVSP